MKVSNISESCSFVLNACQPKRKKLPECEESTWFGNSLTNTEVLDVEKLLAVIVLIFINDAWSIIDQASFMNINKNDNNNQPLDYWMTAGSMIGSLAHHGMIPWK